ncbi:hypothetical protein AVEN_32579-1 [Araneus ventricosus]|uniref:Uncharacterized protein n=1 Tax=Araneus ventricosus TaxID=182803 RepID=A0A4Y2C8Y5_ARAVE|nr:hypothetical protein AVEN_32579-1 [Araneus ventricosus]
MFPKTWQYNVSRMLFVTRTHNKRLVCRMPKDLKLALVFTTKYAKSVSRKTKYSQTTKIDYTNPRNQSLLEGKFVEKEQKQPESKQGDSTTFKHDMQPERTYSKKLPNGKFS